MGYSNKVYSEGFIISRGNWGKEIWVEGISAFGKRQIDPDENVEIIVEKVHEKGHNDI